MRISDFSTNKAADVLVELTPHIENIFANEHLAAVLKDIAETDVSNIKSRFQYVAFAATMYSRLAPILLKERREDVYSILSILNEKTVEEIAAQNIVKTLEMIREVFTDEQLIGFFKPSGNTVPIE